MTATPAEYVDSLNREYERVHTAKEDAFWAAYMGLEDDADAARQTLGEREAAYGKLLQDPERLASARAACARAEAEDAPETVRVALRGWVNTFESHVVDSAEGRQLVLEITELETRLAGARAKMMLGYDKPGVGFTEASSVELGVLVGTHRDEATRRAAWQGLRSIERVVLGGGFLELVRKRNQLGRILGADDYYDWRTRRVERMTKLEIFALLDELEQRTREPARIAREMLRRQKGPDAARPHNVGFHVAGDVTAKQDAYFPFAASLARWGKSFAALGVSYRGAELVLDLVDRKGKYENGFMHGPVVAWRDGGVFRPARIHFTANAIPGLCGSGERATQTLFHEGGHAAHFANVDMPAPCFGQEFAPTSVAFSETQSMFLDRILGDADWQTRYAKTAEGMLMPAELIQEAIAATHPHATTSLRTMLSVCYAERAIYEIPDEELTADRVLAVVRDVERRMAFEDEGSRRPTLSVPHLLSAESSAYYHGYVLALMAVHQTRKHFLDRDGYLVDNARVGPDLKKSYWQVGNSKSFPEFIRNLTGHEVTAVALADDANASVEQKAKEASEVIARLNEIPSFDGDIELDATIRVMHGREQVASNETGGFENLSRTFADWARKKEKDRAG